MKVSLRPLEEQDAYQSVKWRNIPEIWNYTLAAGRAPVRVEDELQWIKRVRRNSDERRLAILADGTYVGNIYLTGIANGSAEYHIVIGERDYWGKGIARAATVQLLDFARDELGLQVVHLIVHPHNNAALSLYRSLGFAEHGFDGAFIRMSLALQGTVEAANHGQTQ